MARVELLAPAGDLEKLKTAVVYGADAVYCGGTRYGLRAAAGNLTLEEIQEGVSFAHRHGARVFVTLNIIAHNEDLVDLPQYIADLRDIGVDAFIVSDPGVLVTAKQIAPNIPIHLSTQASNTNWLAARFWVEQGVARIILARELSMEEIREIRNKVAAELEVFVHGAMCISYSGRCLLSNYLTGRDANRGECTQPCRWKYYLVEETRSNQYFPVCEDERGTYIMNSKDLCMIEHIPELISLGVNSLKIEGRMKSVHYVATVTRVYRQALEAYYRDPEGYRYDPNWLAELSKVSHRPFFTGFYFGKPEDGQTTESSRYHRAYDFIGVVKEYNLQTGLAVIEQRNHFAVGEEIEVMNPTSESCVFTIESLTDVETNEPIARARHAKQLVYCQVPEPVEPYAIVRRKRQ